MRQLEEHSYATFCATDRHDFHQLLVGLDGALDIEVEGRGGRIQAGSVCVIPAGAVHHYLALGTGNRCLTLNLNEAGLLEGEKQLFDQVSFRQLAADRRLDAQSLQGYLDESWDLPRVRLNLARLAASVLNRLAEPWPLARLAGEANLSERQLRRLLLNSTGLTPRQWLMRLRLDAALKALATTHTTITDIALDCGFQDPAHFSRRVRAHTGLTPRQWRRRMADSDKFS